MANTRKPVGAIWHPGWYSSKEEAKPRKQVLSETDNGTCETSLLQLYSRCINDFEAACLGSDAKAMEQVWIRRGIVLECLERIADERSDPKDYSWRDSEEQRLLNEFNPLPPDRAPRWLEQGRLLYTVENIRFVVAYHPPRRMTSVYVVDVNREWFGKRARHDMPLYPRTCMTVKDAVEEAIVPTIAGFKIQVLDKTEKQYIAATKMEKESDYNWATSWVDRGVRLPPVTAHLGPIFSEAG